MEEQHEHYKQRSQRCDGKRSRGTFFAFELAAVDDIVVFGQFHLAVYGFFDVVYGTAQVATVDVCRYKNAAADVLAADAVRSACRHDVGNLLQRHFSKVGVDGYVAQRLDAATLVVGKAHG